MKIIIGTNTFEDCESQITIAGVPLFSVHIDSPLFVNTPNYSDTPSVVFSVKSPPAKVSVSVEDNEVQEGDVLLKTSRGTVMIYYGAVGHVLSLNCKDNLNVQNTEQAGRVIFKVDIQEEADRPAWIKKMLKEHETYSTDVAAEMAKSAVVQFDLRPLGLNIYTDEASLKIEGAIFAHNHFKKLKTGIAIG